MTRSVDIGRVRRHGARHRGRSVELRVLQIDAATRRVGIVVPRHSHSAVARNLVKRRLRDIARLLLPTSPAGADIVIFALPLAYGTTFGALQRELQRMWPARANDR